ncbi:MAG TPA: VOC family protein [Vicinamibacterales bacterium]|nr:VOC family protein [Vicinamibacterales bacterium]
MVKLCGVLATLALLAQAPAVERPKILGVAHFAVYVSDLANAREFYQGLLGYDEPFTLPRADGAVEIAFVKINDMQWIELFNRPSAGEGQLAHIALYTDDAERMRAYLAAKGVKVPAAAPTGRTGNKNFMIKDPDGHDVEIVEYRPDSWTAKDRGQHLPAARISDRAMHVGILVGSLEAADAFYGDILGFREFWRGSAATSKTLSWVNMRVPDGSDYIEFMLYDEMPAPGNRGSAHHICLVVPNADEAIAKLDARPARKAYERQVAIRTGINRKRQINLFDPDGTRVELMEPDTVDGRPAPSSTLPAPRK